MAQVPRPQWASDPAAVAAIAELTDWLGYDPVRLESLPSGRVEYPGARC